MCDLSLQCDADLLTAIQDTDARGFFELSDGRYIVHASAIGKRRPNAARGCIGMRRTYILKLLAEDVYWPQAA